MTNDQIWNDERPVSDVLDCDVPHWIEQNISGYDIIAICQGGCASGAYMPAVTYSNALAVMNEHGDDVLQYIEGNYGELPKPREGESWAGMAVHYLSIAVELWASGRLCELEALDIEDEEESA